MNDLDSLPPSPNHAVVALVPTDPDWHPIFHASNQVVLYNSTSHALAIRHSSSQETEPATSKCPLCKRRLPPAFEVEPDADADRSLDSDTDPTYHSRAANYFQLLAIANETSSRPSTPPPTIGKVNGKFSPETMAEGYFKAFFQEECRLGMGANGSVYLCQHVLDGNPLGHFAVKKIAVGESHSYLLKILREVRLLERLHHPNIITYHHAWLELCQFSSFGPEVPTLHVLMQWAEGGSLDDFIDARLGRPTKHIHIHPVGPLSRPSSTSRINNSSNSPISSQPDLHLSSSPTPDMSYLDLHSRSARIRAFRAYQRASPEEREKMKRQMQNLTCDERPTLWTPVHLLSAEEVKSLFSDVADGLAFLHSKSILHLDLKPGNVLLTWDEGKLIPRAMLSDFGTSRDMLHSSRNRSGNTGTLEYTSPESLPSPGTGILKQIDSKADMWSLGMILHKLLFFRLPYRYASAGDANGEVTPDINDNEKMDRLEQEVLTYPGFKYTQSLVTTFKARRLPQSFLVLLESLLHVLPSGRPSCERVVAAIREGKLDPLDASDLGSHSTSLIPVISRPTSSEAHSSSHIREEAGDDLTEQDRDAGEKGNNKLDTPTAEERAPFLELPPLDNGEVQSRLEATYSRIPQLLWRRTVKSSILIVKVISLMSLCSGHFPHPAMVFVVLSMAVMDTWFDGIWISVLFGLLHVGMLWLGSLTVASCS